MKVHIHDLMPNTHRDFEIYPIDEAQVERLCHSINDLGFFQGVTARRHPALAGKYELACGHHRVAAAKLAGVDEVDATVGNYSDDDMTRIMIAENATQRGHNAAANLDSVASAIRRVVAKTFSTGNFASGIGKTAQADHILKDGPGRDSIYEFINGYAYTEANNGEKADALVKMSDIRTAVASLKASGHMVRIVTPVYEAAKATANAELDARRKADEARLAKELADAEAAQAFAEERAKKETNQKEARKVVETARKAAEAKKAERDALDAERVNAEARERVERDKLKNQMEVDAVYDIRCAHVFKRNDHEKTFREWIVENAKQAKLNKERPLVAFADQANVAMEIRDALDKAEKKSGHTFGSVFIRRWLNEKAMELLGMTRELDDHQKKLKIAASAQLRVDDLWSTFKRGFTQAYSAFQKIVEENNSWPHSALFPIDHDAIDKMTSMAQAVLALQQRYNGPIASAEKRTSKTANLKIVNS